MVLLSAQMMPVAKIAEVTFTSEDRVRDVIHNFNVDGFDSLYPKYAGGHLFAAYVLARDHLFGHVKPRKKRTQFLEFCRYLRTLYPAQVRIAIVCDNYSPHLTTKRCRRVADWAEANTAEIAYTPTNSSWLNRIEAQFTALRYFALDGTDHRSHKEQGSMNRRYIIWRNRHADDTRLRQIIARANVA